MRHVIDISKSKFDFRVDFSEATIVDFYAPLELPESMQFTVWGATLLLNPAIWGREPKHAWGEGPRSWSPFPNDMTDDMYVSGIGTVKLDKLTGGKIQVYYGDPVPNRKGCIDIVKCRDGSELIRERIWTPKGQQGADEYLWENWMDWPYGACVLYLYSDGGTVTYEFDSDDIIPAIDYIKAPKKYGYNLL